MKNIIPTFILFTAFFFFSLADSQAFWPNYQFDPGRTGQSDYKVPDKLDLKWSVDVFGKTGYVNSPVIDKQGNVYIFGKKEKRSKDIYLYVLSPEGKIKKTIPFYSKFDEPITMPAFSPDGETLYVYTIDSGQNYLPKGILHAISVRNLKEKWAYEFIENTTVSFTPLTVSKDGTIYVSTIFLDRQRKEKLSKVHAVTAQGKLKWSKGFMGLVTSVSLSKENDKIYFLSTSNRDKKAILNCYTTSGEKIYRYKTSFDSSFYNVLTVDKDGYIYLPAEDKAIYKFKYVLKNNYDITKLSINKPVIYSNTAVFNDGSVVVDFGSGSENGFYALFSHKGEVLWKHEIEAPYLSSAPIIDGNENIISLGSDGHLYVFSKKGKVLAKSEYLGDNDLMGHSPAIHSDGSVYVLGGDGKLYGFYGKNKIN